MAYVLALLLAGYYLSATAAFQLAPVAEAALLLNTSLLFVIFLRGMQGMPPVRAEILGTFLAMGGMALIMVPKITFGGQAPVQHLYGHLSAIGAAVLNALYAFTYRFLAEQGRAPEASSVSILTFAAGSMVLIVVLSLTPTPSGSTDLNGSSLLVFLGLGILSTAVPTVGFAITSKRLPSIVTATISLFTPVFAGLFAFLILGESISMTFMAGCLLVLGGVALVIRQNEDMTGNE